MPFRVLVADDHPLFRFAVVQSLMLRPELELVGQARSGREAINLLRDARPDVAALEVHLPDVGGLDVIRVIQRDQLGTRVLFLSAELRPALSYELVEAGAAGVLGKDSPPEAIADALVRIGQGETVVAPEVQTALITEVRDRRDRPKALLSPREHQVLGFLADGLTAPQIAHRLELSPSTIKTHLKRLYERLDVSDRAAAVAEGMRRGFIE